MGAGPCPSGPVFARNTSHVPRARGRLPSRSYSRLSMACPGSRADLCRMFARWGLAAIGVDSYRHEGDPHEAYEALSDRRALQDLDEIHEFIVSDDVKWAVSGDLGILGLDVGGRFIVGAADPAVGQVGGCAYAPLTGDEDREYQVASYLDNLPVPVLGLYGTEDELIASSSVDEAQRRNDHGQWPAYEVRATIPRCRGRWLQRRRLCRRPPTTGGVLRWRRCRPRSRWISASCAGA